ncbi:MAG: hypothetical protein AAB654_23735, partial [Acidobacteriota bacterium]
CLCLEAWELPTQIHTTSYPKAKGKPQIQTKGEKEDESVQNSNDGVLYGADGSNTRTNRKGGRLEQEDRDHV